MEMRLQSQKRVAIFIDGRNFYHSVRDLFEVHDNVEVYWKQQKFFSRLRRIPGFHVILCNMRKIIKPGGEPEFSVKGDDIHLATDMISMAYENLYDVAVLV